MFATHMDWHFGNDHFQCGPDSTVQEMAAVRGAIDFANHHVRMKHRFAIFFHDVAGKGEDFHLLFYRNLPIAFPLSIEETECDFTERANGCDLCAMEPIFSSK